MRSMYFLACRVEIFFALCTVAESIEDLKTNWGHRIMNNGGESREKEEERNCN